MRRSWEKQKEKWKGVDASEQRFQKQYKQEVSKIKRLITASETEALPQLYEELEKLKEENSDVQKIAAKNREIELAQLNLRFLKNHKARLDELNDQLGALQNRVNQSAVKRPEYMGLDRRKRGATVVYSELDHHARTKGLSEALYLKAQACLSDNPLSQNYIELKFFRGVSSEDLQEARDAFEKVKTPAGMRLFMADRMLKYNERAERLLDETIKTLDELYAGFSSLSNLRVKDLDEYELYRIDPSRSVSLPVAGNTVRIRARAGSSASDQVPAEGKTSDLDSDSKEDE
jgi:hypothetical protein